MPRQFPHYDIDAVIREKDPLHAVWWFHDNMPYGCSNPEPDEALMFPEERVPRDIHQLTTYVPNGLRIFVDNWDNIGDVYRGREALMRIGSAEALAIIDEVVDVLNRHSLSHHQEADPEFESSILSIEVLDELEREMEAIDQKYVWNAEHTWDRLEKVIERDCYQYILNNLEVYRQRKPA